MKITDITVNASSGFTHPDDPSASLQLTVTLTAKLYEEDNPDYVVRALQSRAERMVSGQKQVILQKYEDERGLLECQTELKRLRRQKVDMERIQDLEKKERVLLECLKQAPHPKSLGDPNAQEL